MYRVEESLLFRQLYEYNLENGDPSAACQKSQSAISHEGGELSFITHTYKNFVFAFHGLLISNYVISEFIIMAFEKILIALCISMSHVLLKFIC